MHDVLLSRARVSPLGDLAYGLRLIRLMRRIRPDYLLSYTAKPVIYGTIAGWASGVRNRFALITGLGYAFGNREDRRVVSTIVPTLYRLALARAAGVFFQNPDDLSLFLERQLINAEVKSVVLKGSGVDLDEFSETPVVRRPITFLMIARLLRDKGVREYVQAAQVVKRRHPEVKCCLVGWIDDSPNAIDDSELEGWLASGAIEFLGRVNDVRPAIAASSVYVLPSYREGTPRTVLEAMAMGRPIITTDVPGCRETVANGVNGCLVPPMSSDSLATAMLSFVDDPDAISRMGRKSRESAEQNYDVHQVNSVILESMGIVSK